jgi:molybdopterin converting factor small subunit
MEPGNSTASSPPPAAGLPRADGGGAASVRVALFAGMAEAAGCRAVEIPWPGGTVAELRAALGRGWPALVPLLDRSAVAVGGRYAADADAVAAGTDDVAVIPPVSGG